MERSRPRRNCSLKKSNSFKLKRMGNIIVCDCCGQGHQLGKNHLYDYPDNIDYELLCGICLQPLVDPVDTPCGHTYCYTCLKGHLKMQKTCPADQQHIKEKDIKPSSLLVRKILDKLTVVCPNNAYCDQTMPRCSLEVHLKYHCPGSYVSCPREDTRSGCDFIGPRCQLEDHLWNCNYGNDMDKRSEYEYILTLSYVIVSVSLALCTFNKEKKCIFTISSNCSHCYLAVNSHKYLPP